MLKIKIRDTTIPVLINRWSNWHYLRGSKFIALSLTQFPIKLVSLTTG